MSNALRADDRQLILDPLNRRHDDLRRKAASWPESATPRCADTTGSGRTAQRNWPPNWRRCHTGIAC